MNKVKAPYLSIIIPTYNSEKLFKGCIFHIQKQIYKDYEILVSDGGSTDNTLKLAKKNKCIIINNKYKLAEPGIYLGMKNAKGSIIMILAVDNFYKSNIAFTKIVKIFKDTPSIYALFPKQDSLKSYSFYTKYTNTFTDPLNHFIYEYASNGRTFNKIYRIKKRTNLYDIYDYSTNNKKPMIALAQGFTVRKSFASNRKKIWDDLEPIFKIIREEKQIAYLHNISIIHNTTRDLNHFIRKQRWSVNYVLLGKGDIFKDRKKSLTRKQVIKLYFYPIYSISIILPIIYALYHLIVDRERMWLYHPFLVFISATAKLYEFAIIKLGRYTSVSRQ